MIHCGMHDILSVPLKSTLVRELYFTSVFRKHTHNVYLFT